MGTPCHPCLLPQPLAVCHSTCPVLDLPIWSQALLVGEAPSCTCGEGTFPMLWPLSCCRAGTQPVGGQRGVRTDRIRPMTIQMLQPCCFQAMGSRWGLGRQPPFKNVHVQGCFERSVCKDGLKWKAADTMASPGCRGSHGGVCSALPWGAGRTLIVQLLSQCRDVMCKGVRSLLGSQEMAQSNGGALIHFLSTFHKLLVIADTWLIAP